MPLRAPSPAKELILVMGGFGSGKTYLWCKVAEWLRRTNSPAKVFVVNTDKPLDMYANSWDGFYNNIVPLSPHPSTMVAGWNEYQQALKKAQDEIDPDRGDFYVIDLADSVWEQVKATFITEVKNETVGNFYLQKRAYEEKIKAEAKAMGLSGDPLHKFLTDKGVLGPVIGGAYGKDWDVIKKMYRDFMLPIYRLGAHVIACTPEKIFDPNEKSNSKLDEDTRTAYEKMGVKPKGESTVGYMFHTTLRLQRADLQTWVINTVRETAGPSQPRPYLVNEKLDADGHFVTKYLIKIAGWRL